MAIKTNYSATPPLAGVPITATGKYAQPNDGTEALSLSVNLVDQTGTAVTVLGSGATATAAAPTYVEGTSDPLSQNLTGDLRSISKITDGTTVVTVATAGADAVANASPGLRVYARGVIYNGTTWDMQRGDATGGTWVQGPASSGSAVTGKPVLIGFNSGGNAQTVGGGAASLYVQGGTGSGSTDTGFPVKVGAKYNSTLPTITDGQRVDLQAGTRGSLHVELWGSDSVTPVSITASNDGVSNATAGMTTRSFGAVFNNTTWDRSRSITGTDGTGLGVQAVEQAGASFANITTGTTTTVKSGTGTLHKIIVNTPVASATITIYNNTAGSGTKIGTITLPSTITSDNPFTLAYDLWFSTGLTLVTSGATDLTVIYR